MGSLPGATPTVRTGCSCPGSAPLNGQAGVCCAGESLLIRFPHQIWPWSARCRPRRDCEALQKGRRTTRFRACLIRADPFASPLGLGPRWPDVHPRHRQRIGTPIAMKFILGRVEVRQQSGTAAMIDQVGFSCDGRGFIPTHLVSLREIVRIWFPRLAAPQVKCVIRVTIARKVCCAAGPWMHRSPTRAAVSSRLDDLAAASSKPPPDAGGRAGEVCNWYAGEVICDRAIVRRLRPVTFLASSGRAAECEPSMLVRRGRDVRQFPSPPTPIVAEAQG